MSVSVCVHIQGVDKSASKLSASIDALTWFNEIEQANSTLAQWGSSGVPHSLLQSIVYPKLATQFSVRADFVYSNCLPVCLCCGGEKIMS